MKFRLLLTFVFAVLPTTLPAAEIFVSRAGSDTAGNGSEAAPFRTLTHVLAPGNGIVHAGDTVTVRGPSGNNLYEECEVRLRVRLTLRSPPGERAHIHCAIPPGFDPDEDENTVGVQIDPGASGSRLSNLEISGSTLYAVFLQTDWEQGTNASGHGPLDVVLEDLHLHDTGRDAIKITPHSDRVTIRRSLIERTGAIYPPGTALEDKNAEGIDNVNGSGMLVEDTVIRDTATTGLYFKGGAQDVIVRRNRIVNAGEFGIAAGFDTSPEFFDITANPQYFEAIRPVVVNNVVNGAQRSGITLWASRDALIANNTVLDARGLDGYGAFSFGVPTQDWGEHHGRPANQNPRILNNIFQATNGAACAVIRHSNEDLSCANCGSGQTGLWGLIGATGMDHNAFERVGGTCVFSDPRPGVGFPLDQDTWENTGSFAQWQALRQSDSHSFEGHVALTADGHLAVGSLAIERGATVVQVTEDIDRQSRTVPYDIGADEASASGGTPPSPPTSTFQIDGRVSGAWGVNPAPTGQGAFFEVIEQGEDRGLYGGWFGASANPATPDAHEFYMLAGTIQGDTALLQFYLETGQRFMQTATITERVVGTATIRFTSCTLATMQYEFPDYGRSGAVQMQRGTPVPAGCEP